MAKIVTDAAGVAAETPGVVRDVSNWAQELQTLTSGNELSSSTELLVNLLGRIYEAFLKNKHLQEEIVKALDSKEGADVIVRIISILSETADSSPTSQECIHKCFNILWDFSDIRGNFVQNLNNTCVVQLCTDNLKNEEKYESEERRKQIVQASLVVLYNLSREDRNTACMLSDEEWSVILQYKDGKDEYLKAISVMILAFLSDEKTEGIKGEEDTTIYMLKLLKEAKQDSSRRKQGFSCTELIEGLNRLALNDSNKHVILENDGIELLMEFIMSEEPSEPEAAAQCLWTLAFDPLNSVQARLEKHVSTLEDVFKLCDSEDMKKAVNGILRTLESTNEPSSQVGIDSKVKGGGHIMVSYAWDGGYGQETARRIAANLKSRGLKVWIDVDEMKGGVFDAMAEAVNNSYVFILCVSDKYRKSNNCRLEAKYAYQHGKLMIPVQVSASITSKSDWLRFLCSDSLYVDFTEGNNFRQRCEDLVEQINRLTRGEDTIDNAPSNSSVLSRQPPSASGWSPDDVNKWLRDNDLGRFSELFRQRDGSTILALKKLRREAPNFFYQCLWELDSKEKRDKLIAILKLTQALDSL